MGIVFDTKVEQSYKSESTCQGGISRRAALKELTHQNVQFLRNLGLRIIQKRGK